MLGHCEAEREDMTASGQVGGRRRGAGARSVSVVSGGDGLQDPRMAGMSSLFCSITQTRTPSKIANLNGVPHDDSVSRVLRNDGSMRLTRVSSELNHAGVRCHMGQPGVVRKIASGKVPMIAFPTNELLGGEECHRYLKRSLPSGRAVVPERT